MSKAVSLWRYLVGPLPMCPNPLVDAMAIEALREFCQKTGLWWERLAAISTVASTAGYALTSANGDVAGIRHAMLDEIDLTPTGEAALDREDAEWRVTEGSPNRYYMGSDRKIYLVYTPASASSGGLDVWVNLMPLRSATTVEDFLYDDHRQAVKDGALSLLLDLERVPWADPGKAAGHRARFDDAILRATQLSNRGRVPQTRRKTMTGRSHRINYF